MKFNKIIREYLHDELTKKRIAANKADDITAIYLSKVKAASDEITAIYNRASVEVREVLANYNMNIPEDDYDLPIRLFERAIFNNDSSRAKIERENKRYERQKEIEKEIEFECALGADRDKFMEMISKVKF